MVYAKIYVKIFNIPNCSKEELMPIIQGKIIEGSTIHTDGWRAYDGLILNGYTQHMSISPWKWI